MENVYKVTLGTGKTVLLREMKVKFEDMAIKAVGSRAGKNQELMQKMMGDELLKILIVEVDGKKVSGSELENLDGIFKYPELLQVRKVVSKIAGLDQLGEEKELEIVAETRTSGAQ